MKKRQAQSTIDLALRENRTHTIIAYSVGISMVVAGLVSIGAAICRDQPLFSLGALTTYVFVPASRFIERLRRENLLIRLLEIGLNNAESNAEAIETIRLVFEEQFRTNRRDNHE